MELSPKHRKFCEEYVRRNFNATDAYQAAYPKASRETARRNGSLLLTNTDIREEIQRLVAERVMGPDEVLTRFAEQARAEYSRYMMPNGTVDLKRLIADGKAHLIKSVKTTQWGVNVEFYDAHAAKELIGKHHGLFKDELRHSGEVTIVKKGFVEVSPNDWDDTSSTADSDL